MNGKIFPQIKKICQPPPPHQKLGQIRTDLGGKLQLGGLFGSVTISHLSLVTFLPESKNCCVSNFFRGQSLFFFFRPLREWKRFGKIKIFCKVLFCLFFLFFFVVLSIFLWSIEWPFESTFLSALIIFSLACARVWGVGGEWRDWYVSLKDLRLVFNYHCHQNLYGMSI